MQVVTQEHDLRHNISGPAKGTAGLYGPSKTFFRSLGNNTVEIISLVLLISWLFGTNCPCKTLFTLSTYDRALGDRMAEIAPHKHCLVCGNSVRLEENFCDELCESKFKSAQRKQQLLFAAFIILMALILFLPSILKTNG